MGRPNILHWHGGATLIGAVGLGILGTLFLRGTPSREGFAVNRFPSYLEHQGLYNVNPEEYRGDEIAPEDDSASYHRSVKRLPPLTWDEFQEVRSATYEALVRYGRLPDMTEKDVRAFYQFCVGDELGDRTVRVELPNFAVLTPEFVKALQRDVLDRTPLWRIFIVAESPETVVIIYPKAVRLGSVPVGGDWEAALPQTVAKVLELREVKEGPHKRQLEYLRRKVPGELKKLRTEPFRILAAFDNYEGDRKQMSVWFLYPGEKRWFGLSLEKPKGAGSGERIAVRRDGMFDDYYVYDPDNQPPFWLKQWVLPAGFKGKLVLEKIRPGPVIERRWAIGFNPTAVITDTELKTMFGRGKTGGNQKSGR